MFGRKNHLRDKKEFEKIYKQGKTIIGDFLFLKIIKNNLNTNHFGWVVSLKVSKKAVARNRIRRRLKEISRENSKDIKPGFNILIIAKPNIVDKEFQEIKKELEELFQKAKIYK